MVFVNINFKKFRQKRGGSEGRVISISAVLHLLHIGFESFEGVLTEYDLATNGLLNICQKSKRKSENNLQYK